jgi:F1F0 ATPase subunit 2
MIWVLKLILIISVGFINGAFFFGGLWFTTQKAMSSKTPALWFILSFVIRMGITVATFYYVSFVGWQWLLVALGGFIIARFAVIYFTKSIEKKRTVTIKEEVS